MSLRVREREGAGAGAGEVRFEVGTDTVMSGWLRSTPNEAHAAANFLYASWPLTSDSSFIGSCSGPSGPHRMSGPGSVLHVSPTVAMLMALARVVGAVPTIRPEEKVPAIASLRRGTRRA